MPKSQVGSFVFMLIVTGLLNLLFPYLFLFDLLFLFVCNADLLLFIIDRNSLVETLCFDWNLRFILEPRWFNKALELSPKVLWVRTIWSSLIQWIDVMTRNPEKHLSFGQNKISLKEEKSFDLKLIILWKFFGVRSRGLNSGYES